MDEDLDKQIAFMIEEARINRLVREREEVVLRPLPEPSHEEDIFRKLIRRMLGWY